MKLVRQTLGSLGRTFIGYLVHISRLVALTKKALFWTFVAPWKGRGGIRWKSTIHQMVLIGFNSIPIVATICFFVGLIMAMQAAYQLERFGASIYVADLVGVAMTRELGPLLTAIIIAGRSGSAIAAEIGTMKVNEEIDALQTMGLNPVRFLVVPRLLALLIVLPCLTIIANLVGILGGFFLAIFNLNISFIRYFHQTADALVMKDLITGLIKTIFFAMIIAQVGAYQGFIVEGGAEGVGKSTTASVVASIFLIIVADLIMTMIFYSTL
ncbi:MAG: ABC transporter permease [candidate division KSB1 bacterium]|nr:ABC transporter permease [candidate division KSB1 bacterium]MDZ7356630.1 ABC transporter permease [candidate division KSB1 bacterium]MDZ7398984.1 ABC transporter permease [candidate division KSB1 bacterium]